MLKRIVSVFIMAVALTPVALALDYDAVATRAARFFSYEEWASAGAMYSLMIDERPYVASTYGHAIVAAGMLDNSAQQIDLTHRAMTAQVPVDSIFTSVERISFSVGQTSLYERYLLLVQKTEPWLVRIIDGYLLRYYTFRRDARGMIVYSGKMLAGMPYDEQFLYTLAQGYLLNGEHDRAVATYVRIVDNNPQAYDALLYLGNYYAARAAADNAACGLALGYLRRALAVKATPYVDDMIRRLASRAE